MYSIRLLHIKTAAGKTLLLSIIAFSSLSGFCVCSFFYFTFIIIIMEAFCLHFQNKLCIKLFFNAQLIYERIEKKTQALYMYVKTKHVHDTFTIFIVSVGLLIFLFCRKKCEWIKTVYVIKGKYASISYTFEVFFIPIQFTWFIHCQLVILFHYRFSRPSKL